MISYIYIYLYQECLTRLVTVRLLDTSSPRLFACGCCGVLVIGEGQVGAWGDTSHSKVNPKLLSGSFPPGGFTYIFSWSANYDSMLRVHHGVVLRAVCLVLAMLEVGWSVSLLCVSGQEIKVERAGDRNRAGRRLDIYCLSRLMFPLRLEYM